MLVKLRVEHDDILLLLGSKTLLELIAVAVVENIVAFHAVFFWEVVLKLIVGIVEHTVAVEVEPCRFVPLVVQRKHTVIDYTRIDTGIVHRIIECCGNS